jgi:hypothetical protein
VNLLTRGHHHTTTDGVKGVRSDTSTGGDSPISEEKIFVSFRFSGKFDEKVTNHPRRKEARKEPWRDPVMTTGLRESYIPVK